MNKFSVSILTVVHSSEFECLKVLFNCIKQQSYKNIKEWIIINESEDPCNTNLINELMQSNNFQIKYIPFQPDKNLSQLKHIANTSANGDYIIWMDYNDYHMPSRIEYSVNKLLFNNKQIGGNINLYFHDIDLEETYKTNIPNTHSSLIYPNTLIYHKDYLQNHKYPYDTIYPSINFEVLMPETTLVKIIHKQNTETNKDLINIASKNKLESGVRKFLVPNNFYEIYSKIWKSNETKENIVEMVPDNKIEYINYDIVYFTGINGINWDPCDKMIHDSEQAIVYLSENWIKQGKTVVVYGLFNEEKTLNGVDYKFSTNFPINKKSKVLILWRFLAVNVFLGKEILADKVILDLHDSLSKTFKYFDRDKLLIFLKKVTKINFKSEYHKKCFEEFIQNKTDIYNYNIIPNGIRIEPFKNNKCLNDNQEIIRNPYRFCYCSSYDRGLEYILTEVWHHIYKQEPRAEFHIYSGMNDLSDDFQKSLRNLISQPGVMDHGSQSMDIIIREKYLSTFHLYLSTNSLEIDCISIRESLVTGCIPIISKVGVFANRDGLQFDWNPQDKNSGKQIADDIINKMYNTELISNFSSQIQYSNTIIDWSDIAQKWLETF